MEIFIPTQFKRIGEKKPKRTVTKYKIERDYGTTSRESFDEYAKKLGVAFTKRKITVHGVNRVRVAKVGPKPKRMLRIDCERNRGI